MHMDTLLKFFLEVQQTSNALTEQKTFQTTEIIEVAKKLLLLRKNLMGFYRQLDSESCIRIDQDSTTGPTLKGPPKEHMKTYEYLGRQMDQANATLMALSTKIEKYFTTSPLIDAFSEQVDMLEADFNVEKFPLSKETSEMYVKKYRDFQLELHRINAMPRPIGMDQLNLKKIHDKINEAQETLTRIKEKFLKIAPPNISHKRQKMDNDSDDK